MIGPDSCVTLDFALHRLGSVIEKLLVYPDNMKSNLEKLGGLVFSQRVLLALTQAGISREDAYRIVQRNAMQVWDSFADGRARKTFMSFLEQDEDVQAKLSKDDLAAIFTYDPYTKHIDSIFKKIF